MRIEVGSPAPDFSLFDDQKNKITLSELNGQSVLLLFFPFAFTSTCTEELCSVKDNLTFYNKVNAKVFGISVDSLYTLAKYRSDQKLNFPLLSDFNKEVSILYDTIYEKFGFNMRGVSKRSAFIIDKAGIIRYTEILENADMQPDFGFINQLLEKLE